MKDLLSEEVQDYINKNTEVSISQLALQKNPFPALNLKEILNQIEAKGKAKDKLPTWFSSATIIYPSKISVEQTSSERTAEYKSSLVSGQNLIDLSGGFGVDDFYFAKNRLYELASHFVKFGGTHFIIDEIHKYPDWSKEIKLIYDYHQELKVAFSGSSILVKKCARPTSMHWHKTTCHVLPIP